MYHELVACQIEVMQRSHGHEREGDTCPIWTDSSIPAKDVIDAFWVVGCGTRWEGAGHEATELLILPDDASPLRVSELDAIAAGLVGAAASAFLGELGSECGASVSTRSEGVCIQPPGAIQEIHIAVSAAHCGKRVCCPNGIHEQSGTPQSHLLRQTYGEVCVMTLYFCPAVNVQRLSRHQPFLHHILFHAHLPR